MEKKTFDPDFTLILSRFFWNSIHPISEFECGSFDLQQMEGRCVIQNEAELQLKRTSTLYSIEENFIKSNNDTEKCPSGSKDYNRLVSLTKY